MKLLDHITPIEEDFAKWYQDVVVKGGLIAYGRHQGAMYIKPIAYGIWEQIRNQLDQILKVEVGAQNVSIPLLIPQSFIAKEQDHIDGFAPELVTITKVGQKDLHEHLVIRPTSEVLFADLFKHEINSYNDLPIIYNQWGLVMRWEKTTNPFLRTREFLWQEGHTSHAEPKTAQDLALKMIKIYQRFLKDVLAIPTIIGQKTLREQFAGAVHTYTIEAMMKDGKALQCGTSHYLGQNFSEPFEIKFKNQQNEASFVYQTSWGVSTRLIGALIMSHGDNRGVIIPPRVAPYQVDILELFAAKDSAVAKAAQNLFDELTNHNFRARIDNSTKGPGFKAGKSEIAGTPLRIEIGPRDLANNLVTIVRRDTLEKINLPIKQVVHKVAKILDSIQDNLYQSAHKRLMQNTIKIASYEEMQKVVKQKQFAVAPFVGDAKAEADIQKATGATARCILMETDDQANKCVVTGQPTKRYVVFGRAY